MTQLNVSRELSLPLDVASQAIAVLGIRGAGKTNTATVIAEELLSKGQPMVYIDPTDGAWGLRSDFPVFIFGGTHGDLPLQETDGKVLAEFVVSEQVPIILSLRHLRKNTQRRFVTEFCEEIYHLKGKPENRTPLTVFIDEAPLFVPQKVMGETARTVGAVEDLIARGRNAGFGVVLISQRSATINKDVLTQCDTIITHRLTSPQDRKALSDWIEENATIEKQKEVLQSLATMPNGRAWVWSPRLDVFKNVQIRLRKTFDSSATPKRGEKPAQPKRFEDVDLGKLKTKLAASIEQAERNDPKLLHKRIAELERNGGPGASAAQLDLARRNGFEDARREFELWRKAVLSDFQQHVSRLHEPIAEIERWIKSLPDFSAPPTFVEHTGKEINASRAALRHKVYPRHSLSGNGAGDASVGTGGLRRILIALAQRPGLTQRQIGVRAGLSSRSGTFSTYISKARTNGWLVDEHGQYTITQEGLKALGHYDPLPTGHALLQQWLEELGAGGASRILREVAKAYPRGLTMEQLGERAELSHRSGTFSTYLSRLRTLQLVERGRGSEVLASSELFD